MISEYRVTDRASHDGTESTGRYIVSDNDSTDVGYPIWYPVVVVLEDKPFLPDHRIRFDPKWNLVPPQGSPAIPIVISRTYGLVSDQKS